MVQVSPTLDDSPQTVHPQQKTRPCDACMIPTSPHMVALQQTKPHKSNPKSSLPIACLQVLRQSFNLHVDGDSGSDSDWSYSSDGSKETEEPEEGTPQSDGEASPTPSFGAVRNTSAASPSRQRRPRSNAAAAAAAATVATPGVAATGKRPAQQQQRQQTLKLAKVTK